MAMMACVAGLVGSDRFEAMSDRLRPLRIDGEKLDPADKNRLPTSKKGIEPGEAPFRYFAVSYLAIRAD